MKLFTVLALSLLTLPAFANGVEKITLPQDAKNIALVNVSVDMYPVGTKEDPTASQYASSNLEGTPQGTAIFAPKLSITFAFDSSEANNEPGSGPDGQKYSWDDSRAHLTVAVDAAPDVLASVKSGKLVASDLVSYSVANESVVAYTQNPDSSKQCAFNYETGMNVDSSCDDSVQTTVVAPVLSILVK